MDEVKKINNKVVLNYFNVYFEYETARKNHRKEQHRVVVAETKDGAVKKFNDWMQNSRTMSNAKILGIFADSDKKLVINV